MAKLRRDDKEWEVFQSEGGFTSSDYGMAGVRSDIEPQVDDIFIDDRGEERRIVGVSPSDAGWFTLHWRTY